MAIVTMTAERWDLTAFCPSADVARANILARRGLQAAFGRGLFAVAAWRCAFAKD
jgi:hypothetical protein